MSNHIFKSGISEQKGSLKGTFFSVIIFICLYSPLVAQASNPHRFDKYQPYKGWVLSLPGPANTIDPEAGGLRQAAADKGIGWIGLLQSYNSYDLINNGHYDHAKGQQYDGQKLSTNDRYYLRAAYDLEQHGIPGGQLQIGVTGGYSSFLGDGPSPQSFAFSNLGYYQTLFDKRVELSFGYMGATFRYIGDFIGGNISSGGIGTATGLDYTTGLSSTTDARPMLNLKFNLGDRFYDKVGVQRSTNPDGIQAEVQTNELALGFSGSHVGWLFINEFGYRQDASADDSEIWIRGGYASNTSDYINYRRPGTRASGNYLGYFLVDKQIYQPAPGSDLTAYKGIYIGGTVKYGPPAYNLTSEDYEIRLYAKGMTPWSNQDQLSFNVAHQVYSKDLRAITRKQGVDTNTFTNSVALTYTVPWHGLNLTGAVQYLDNPMGLATERGHDGGLLGIMSINVWF